MLASDADTAPSLLTPAETGVTIGVDMVEVARVRAVIARYGSRFLARVYTPDEQRYASGRVYTLAGRFAAKEATAKALGTGIGPVGWRNIEVVADVHGKPALVLHGPAAARARAIGKTEWHVSITHSRELATAFVVGRRADEPSVDTN